MYLNSSCKHNKSKINLLFEFDNNKSRHHTLHMDQNDCSFLKFPGRKHICKGSLYFGSFPLILTSKTIKTIIVRNLKKSFQVSNHNYFFHKTDCLHS